MTDSAQGIQEHPQYKLGLRAPSNKPALELGQFLTGVVVPKSPPTMDHLRALQFGMYGNDQYGVCGPTSVANLRRLVTGGLLGAEIAPTQEDVFDLYRRSGNPNFDPATGADDNGVDMQTMLEALLAGGIGGVKPVAFARIKVRSNTQLSAGASIFGGGLWGVTLQTAQQAQTDAQPPQWTYVRSSTWGGHAVLNGAYEGSGHEDVITWAQRVQTTTSFRSHQLGEAWVVIWEENVEHPAFQAGIDIAKLKDAYRALTGQTLNI